MPLARLHRLYHHCPRPSTKVVLWQCSSSRSSTLSQSACQCSAVSPPIVSANCSTSGQVSVNLYLVPDYFVVICTLVDHCLGNVYSDIPNTNTEFCCFCVLATDSDPILYTTAAVTSTAIFCGLRLGAPSSRTHLL